MCACANIHAAIFDLFREVSFCVVYHMQLCFVLSSIPYVNSVLITIVITIIFKLEIFPILISLILICDLECF